MKNVSTFFIFQPFKNESDIEHALKRCYGKDIQTLAEDLRNKLHQPTNVCDKIGNIYLAALNLSNPLDDAQKWFHFSDISENLNNSLAVFLATDSLFFLRARAVHDEYTSLEEYYSTFSGEIDAEKSTIRNFNNYANDRLRNTPLRYLWDSPQKSGQDFFQQPSKKQSYKIPKFMDDFLYRLLTTCTAHPFSARYNTILKFVNLKSFFNDFYTRITPVFPYKPLSNAELFPNAKESSILSNYLARQLFDLNTASYISNFLASLGSSTSLTLDTILDYLVPVFFIPNPFARTCYCNLIFRLSFSGDMLITHLDNHESLEANILASAKPTWGPATTQERNLQKTSQFLQHQIFSVYPLLRSVFFYFLCRVFPDDQREAALVSFIQANPPNGAIDYDFKKSEATPPAENLTNETGKTFPQFSDYSEASWAAFWKALEPNSASLVSIFKKLNAKLSNPEFIKNLYQSSQLNFIDSTELYREKILDTVVTAKAKTDVGLFPHYDLK